ISAGVAVAIIGIRAMTLMGAWQGFAGVALPAAAIMAVTLVAAIWTPLQGIVLTAEGLAFFIVAMMLMPKVNAASTTFWGLPRNPTAAVAQPPSGGTGVAVEPPASSKSAEP